MRLRFFAGKFVRNLTHWRGTDRHWCCPWVEDQETWNSIVEINRRPGHSHAVGGDQSNYHEKTTNLIIYLNV